MGRTKKVGMSGRFGPKYGSIVRINWNLIMEKQKGAIKCPRCFTKDSIHRVSVGIWHCKKCGAKFTGGAYYIETPRGAESFRIAARKQRELDEMKL